MGCVIGVAWLGLEIVFVALIVLAVIKLFPRVELDGNLLNIAYALIVIIILGSLFLCFFSGREPFYFGRCP